MTALHFYALLIFVVSSGLAYFSFSLLRALKKIGDVEVGLGGAIAVMICEVDRLELAIASAKEEAKKSADNLIVEIERSKEERALWVLQKQLGSDSGGEKRLQLQRRHGRRGFLIDA